MLTAVDYCNQLNKYFYDEIKQGNLNVFNNIFEYSPLKLNHKTGYVDGYKNNFIFPSTYKVNVIYINFKFLHFELIKKYNNEKSASLLWGCLLEIINNELITCNEFKNGDYITCNSTVGVFSPDYNYFRKYNAIYNNGLFYLEPVIK